MGQINLYTAVEEMKAVSKAEGTFSIKFRKYNRQKQSGGVLVFLKAARLRYKASVDKIENASHKLFLVDTEPGNALNCWQILVVVFNGQKTVL